MQEKNNNLMGSVKVFCPGCKRISKMDSEKIYNIGIEDFDFVVNGKCKNSACQLTINEHVWTETGADGEKRLCIGNRDNIDHPVATASGVFTTNGKLDENKVKKLFTLKNIQGIKPKIINSKHSASRL